MSTGSKNCNFSCTCNREECERKHYIENPDDRATVKDIYDEYLVMFILLHGLLFSKELDVNLCK